jgi:hypothetical protein
MKTSLIIGMASLMLFVAVASAQPYLQPESHFLDIPSSDSLSTSRFLALTDSTDNGYFEPRDVEVLRLSPTTTAAMRKSSPAA